MSRLRPHFGPRPSSGEFEARPKRGPLLRSAAWLSNGACRRARTRAPHTMPWGSRPGQRAEGERGGGPTLQLASSAPPGNVARAACDPPRFRARSGDPAPTEGAMHARARQLSERCARALAAPHRRFPRRTPQGRWGRRPSRRAPQSNPTGAAPRCAAGPAGGRACVDEVVALRSLFVRRPSVDARRSLRAARRTLRRPSLVAYRIPLAARRPSSGRGSRNFGAPSAKLEAGFVRVCPSLLGAPPRALLFPPAFSRSSCLSLSLLPPRTSCRRGPPTSAPQCPMVPVPQVSGASGAEGLAAGPGTRGSMLVRRESPCFWRGCRQRR